jgi:RND superfamily putative drug exporter
MASVLSHLGAFAYARRRVVLASWLGVLVVVAAAAGALDGSTNDTFTVPGAESQRAITLLDQTFPGTGGAVARIVFAAPPGHTLVEPRYKKLVAPTVARARKVPQSVLELLVRLLRPARGNQGTTSVPCMNGWIVQWYA